MITIRANAPLWDNSIHILVGQQTDQSGRFAVAQPLTFVDHDPGRVIADPTMRIDSESARQLMDELWRCGVRPTQVGTAGHLSALQAHLDDMRKLVFER
jgi:hypothetical protein